MARKDGSTLKGRQGAVLGSTREAAIKSWAVVGLDTSLSSIAAVAYGYDALRDRVSVTHGEIRWMPEVDYYVRLGQAAKCHNLILDLLRNLWVVDPERVFIAVEEAVHYGALQRGIASFAKQQIEVAGAVKGSLVRYGFPNIVEVNNSTWKKTAHALGCAYQSVPRGSTSSEKSTVGLANKMATKEWAVKMYGLPDLPDLVASKSGAKIPRPESGFGAKAKAVQPDDTYDAAGVMTWLLEDLRARGVL